MISSEVVNTVNGLSSFIHRGNVEAGWWNNLNYWVQRDNIQKLGYTVTEAKEILDGLGINEQADRNVGELLCLVHSEVSEAMEGFRKNLMDDKLPHRSMFEVELADVLIRIFDIAGKHQLDLGGAIKEKLEYNSKRADHKIENRMTENGKKF